MAASPEIIRECIQGRCGWRTPQWKQSPPPHLEATEPHKSRLTHKGRLTRILADVVTLLTNASGSPAIHDTFGHSGQLPESTRRPVMTGGHYAVDGCSSRP